MTPIVFLDKDGTLVENVPFNVDPARIALCGGAAEGLRALAARGFRFAVVSNQSGVARGYFEESDLVAVHQRLSELLDASGVNLAGFFYCPHHPAGAVARYARACACRKPAPGLLLDALRELGGDSRDCWMVGDILDDVEAGARAGCRTVLIDNGNETEWQAGPHRVPDIRAKDLTEAATLMLK
ncbi:MAG TPA: HAD family hydrolase [Urbifossiella sp.]|nr:HAD family hydrolase [Urbifossiella sp.]